MSLISADELATWIEAPPADVPVVVCDVRFSLHDHARGAREYAAGHVPGARFVDLHDELADTSIAGRGRHPLPTPEAFTTLLGRLGITPATTVVAYDSASGATASRLWWMLRSIGHPDARVLDGGWQAWLAAGLAADTAAGTCNPTSYPTAHAWSGTVTADELVAALAVGAVVVDSRAPERYRGDSEPLDPRAGHVPGAINVFHGANVGSDGHLLPGGTLAERFGAAGVGRATDPPPIVYCGSGVTACHNVLAMELAGIRGARLYVGSWSEWSSDASRPVAVGAAP